MITARALTSTSVIARIVSMIRTSPAIPIVIIRSNTVWRIVALRRVGAGRAAILMMTLGHRAVPLEIQIHRRNSLLLLSIFILAILALILLGWTALLLIALWLIFLLLIGLSLLIALLSIIPIDHLILGRLILGPGILALRQLMDQRNTITSSLPANISIVLLFVVALRLAQRNGRRWE